MASKRNGRFFQQRKFLHEKQDETFGLDLQYVCLKLKSIFFLVF